MCSVIYVDKFIMNMKMFEVTPVFAGLPFIVGNIFCLFLYYVGEIPIEGVWFGFVIDLILCVLLFFYIRNELIKEDVVEKVLKDLDYVIENKKEVVGKFRVYH